MCVSSHREIYNILKTEFANTDTRISFTISLQGQCNLTTLFNISK